jgi:cell pole-organizing protein PopZ
MASTQHEPTMEEILASIRKIISEDSTEAPAAPAAAAPAAPAPAPVAVAAEPEVLELTQEIEEEPAPAPEPEPLRPAPVVEAKADDIVFETIEEAPVSEPVRGHSDIFSDSTRKAMDDAFAGLDEEDERRPAYDRGPIAPVDGANVEAVFDRAIRESFDPVLRQWLDANADAVVERMKPLIREWMDEHFPALLEGAVRNEVARVVQARGKKR